MGLFPPPSLSAHAFCYSWRRRDHWKCNLEYDYEMGHAARLGPPQPAKSMVTTIQYVWLLLHNICAWFSFRFIYSTGLCVNLPCCLAGLRLANIRWKPIVSDCMYSICVILKVKPKSAHYVLGVSVWLEDGLAGSPKCSAMIGSSCHCGVRYWNLAGQIALSYFDIVWQSMLCRFLFFLEHQPQRFRTIFV